MMSVSFPESENHVLQWKRLSLTGATTASSASDANLAAVHENIQKALEQKRWLLEEDQCLNVPPTHLDRIGPRIFSLGDFVIRSQKARGEDVFQSSLDEYGGRSVLTDQQIEQIKETGELSVPSKLFHNQTHTWKVARGFYSGRQPVRESFRQGVGKTLDHYVVSTGDAIAKKDQLFTIRNAFDTAFVRPVRLIRGAVGQIFAGSLKHRKYTEADIEYVLAEAELGYVQYHLQKGGHGKILPRRGLVAERGAVQKAWDFLEEDAGWGALYRRSEQDLIEAQQTQIMIQRHKKGFDSKMNQRRRQELPTDETKLVESPLAALRESRRAAFAWAKSSEQQWINWLRSCGVKELEEFAPFEADRLMAMQIEADMTLADEDKVKRDASAHEVILRKKYPLLSLSGAWRRRRLDKYRQEARAALETTRLDRVAIRLEEEGLHTESEYRRLSRKFRTEEKDALAKRLRAHWSAFPPAKFEVLQLNPNNWKIENGHIQKHKTVEVKLDNPFWRLSYTWMMAVTLTKNNVGGGLHFLASGPLSMRALFSAKEYYAVERPVRDESSFTPTLWSRLRSFHAALSAVRERFDAAPDTGLIGKSIQSFFLFLYLSFKSIIGSFLIISFMVLGTILASTVNVLFLSLSPVLATTWSAFVMLFNLVIYDTAIQAASVRYNPSGLGLGTPEMPSCVSPVVKICFELPVSIVLGALQALVAALRLAVIHPLMGTIHFAWTSLRFALRSVRDSLTWFFIRRYSRVPASDTFLAWRIHGPGLAPTQYYRLPLNAAKAGVLLLLDKYRLKALSEVRQAELKAPYECYKAMFSDVFKPFGLVATTKIPDPLVVSNRIVSKAPKQHAGKMTQAESFHDIWGAVADEILSSNPDHRRTMRDSSRSLWDYTEVEEASLSSVDSGIRSVVLKEARILRSREGHLTELHEMVYRAAEVLAQWNLQASVRDLHLTHAVAIPPEAAGRFRLDEADLHELWKFARAAAEVYGRKIEMELEEIVNSSDFSGELRGLVRRVVDSFYSASGARPGKDFPLVASFLLKKLLGDETLLEPLEEVDERLVLSPKIPEEDEHLVFWRSLSCDQNFVVV